MKYTLLCFCLCFATLLHAQVSNEQTHKALNELAEFIALPNFGLNEADIQKNIHWLEQAFQRRKFKTQTLLTQGNPLFFAQWKVDEQLPTILFYMHMDGQAVDHAKWAQANPYETVIKHQIEGEWVDINVDKSTIINPDWRIFGRSTSDDKGPIIAFLNSIDAIHQRNITPQFNIKVVLDAEEELGSKPLAEAVKDHKHILQADALIINDGPVHVSGQPTLNFGCRGIMTLNMTTYGPSKPQHSGHYGNYAPNPVFRLANLLTSMKDDDGRVLIDDYYDGIELDAETKAILAKVPDNPQVIHELLEINTPEKVGQNYQEALQYPSLNARGIAAGWVGAKARTIVPDNATVAIDIRLVPESDPKRLIQLIQTHAQKEGFHIVDHEPTSEERLKYPKLLFFYSRGATLPFRTDLNAPLGNWLTEVIQTEFKEDPVKIRIMGGTVPIAAFINELAIPAVIVPMVNPDNNQHSPNENLRIGHFQYSMQLFEAILAAKPKL